MCMFSGNVRFVGATRIFARREAGRQLLAYAMSVEMDGALAMVLPLPVPPAPAEDAVEFVDLKGYADFFDDLAKAFPVAVAAGFSQSLSREAPAERTLVVHDVGDFVASFVPTRKDFARLDPRFRLPEHVFDRLPQYTDFGFAVFQLKPSRNRQDVHPMAFSFPSRDEGIFFPTVHVHDGRVESQASFDHTLYCQADGMIGATLGWERSANRLGASVDVAKSRGLVDGDAIGFKEALFGPLTNDDVWLRAPEGIGMHELRGAGECFEFRIGASYAYTFGVLPESAERWRRTARHDLGRVARALREGLPALVSARRERWRLAPITPGMPEHFMNGDRFWSGTDYMSGQPGPPRGVRGVVTFSPFTKRVHAQTVRLGFDATPDDGVVSDIGVALKEILDNALRFERS
jgi:hypothetical protein